MIGEDDQAIRAANGPAGKLGARRRSRAGLSGMRRPALEAFSNQTQNRLAFLPKFQYGTFGRRQWQKSKKKRFNGSGKSSALMHCAKRSKCHQDPTEMSCCGWRDNLRQLLT